MASEPTDPQSVLVDRILPLLAGQGAVRVVSMFGGKAFMLDEAMVVSAGGTGDLLVRVDPHLYDALLEREGARQAEMGTGRTMGKGWIRVSANAIDGDDDLQEWLTVALDHHRAATRRPT